MREQKNNEVPAAAGTVRVRVYYCVPGILCTRVNNREWNERHEKQLRLSEIITVTKRSVVLTHYYFKNMM